MKIADKNNLFADYGEDVSTVRGTIRFFRAVAPTKPIQSAGEYVAVCRRLYPYLNDAALKRHLFQGRLIAAGFNRVPPKVWCSSIDGGLVAFLLYWGEAVQRPEVVGSCWNPTPEACFQAFRLGLPANLMRGIAPHLWVKVLNLIHKFRLVRKGKIRAGRWSAVKSMLKLLALVPRVHGVTPALVRIVARNPGNYLLRWVVAFVMNEHYRENYSLRREEQGAVWERISQIRALPRADQIKLVAPTNKGVWGAFHRFVPKVESLVQLPREQIERFPIKQYLQVSRYLEVAFFNQDERANLAYRIAATFGSEWKGWIRRIEKGTSLRLGNSYRIHDGCYWLPTNPLPGFVSWLRNQDIDRVLSAPADFGKVVSYWPILSNEDRKCGSVELLRRIDKLAINIRLEGCGLDHRAFAVESLQWGARPHDLKGLEEKFTKYREVLAETIPFVRVTNGKYTLESLQRGDPVGPWLGQYTDCCQYPSGVGESCAWHGTTDPNGGFWVVRESEDIVAQGWVWRNGDTLVIDNVEAKGRNRRMQSLITLFEVAARQAIGRLEVKQVNIGTGGSDIDLPWPETTVIYPPDNCYSDARGEQRCIAKLEESEDNNG